MTYTFCIRNMLWSDGAQISASDFENSWKEAIDPSFDLPSYHNFFPIKNAEKIRMGKLPPNALGVKALNDKTLIIELEHPTSYLLELLAFCPFFPVPPNFDQKAPVSSGPFHLERWEEKKSMTLAKNPLFFNATNVKLSKIHISFIDDKDLVLELYEKNHFDLIGHPLCPLPENIESEFVKDKKIRPISGSYFLAFNCNTPFFQNLNIRKAFSLFIPREEISKKLHNEYYQAAYSPVPEILYGEESFKNLPEDESKALEYFEKGLQELGLTRKTFKPVFFYENKDITKQIAELLQEKIRSILQLELTFFEMNFKGLINQLIRKDFDFALTWWVAQYNDPMNFFERYKYASVGKNFSGWEKPEYVQLLDKASKTQQHKRRLQILQKAEKILIDDAPIAPILHFHSSFLQKPHVKGVTISPIGSIHFDRTYIDHTEFSHLHKLSLIG